MKKMGMCLAVIFLVAVLVACTGGSGGGGEENAHDTTEAAETADTADTAGITDTADTTDTAETTESNFETVQGFALRYIEEMAQGLTVGVFDYGDTDSPVYIRAANIIDTRIDVLEKEAEFDNILPYMVELWRLDFMLQTDDIETETLRWGTFSPDDDGWLGNQTAWSEARTLLVFSRENDALALLGSIPWYMEETQYGLEGALWAFLAEISGLQVAVTHSNGFGVGFLVRNRTGNRLYYNDDFRVDGVALTESNNPAGVQSINHGDTKDTYVSWGGDHPTGTYTFERDFFLDAELTELYTTLSFEFDVIGWYFFIDNAPPIPEELQTRRDEQARKNFAFKMEGGASQVIVPAGEVEVSRTEIAFSTANLSTQPFIHGLSYSLIVYDNGWKPAPMAAEEFAVASIGFGMEGGQIIEDRINFEAWYGVLENGRYMLVRHHLENHSRPGAPRVQENLMVEFVVDDNTPTRLRSN